MYVGLVKGKLCTAFAHGQNGIFKAKICPVHQNRTPKSHIKRAYPFRKAVQATRNRLRLGTVARPALSWYPGFRRTRPIST